MIDRRHRAERAAVKAAERLAGSKFLPWERYAFLQSMSARYGADWWQVWDRRRWRLFKARIRRMGAR